MSGPRTLNRLDLLVALLVVSLLGACVTQTTQSQSQAPSPELKDRATASDETDAVKRGRARLELAAAYFSRGQLQTALDQVKLAIQADPNSSAAYNLRGLIYASLGDQPLAEESFRRALQLNPRDADAMQNYGWYLCQLKRYPEADAMFAQALAVPQYRDAPRTLLAQGVCQAFAGNLDQSEATLSKSYELDPNNPATVVNLAEVLYRKGEYERARFFVRRVNSLPEVSNAQTLWLAARIEHRLGNQQGADAFGTQLRNRFPQSREASSFQRGAFDE